MATDLTEAHRQHLALAAAIRIVGQEILKAWEMGHWLEPKDVERLRGILTEGGW